MIRAVVLTGRHQYRLSIGSWRRWNLQGVRTGRRRAAPRPERPCPARFTRRTTDRVLGRRPGSGAPNKKGASNAFEIDFNGGTPRSLAPEFATSRSPIWSPDGKLVLFLGSRVEGKVPDWCLASLESPSDVKCLDAARSSANTPRKSRQWIGKTVTWFSITMMAMREDLWRIRMDASARQLSGQPERLTYGPGVEGGAVFGPGGEILFTDTRSATDIWSVRLDSRNGTSTGPEQTVTSDPAFDVLVRASADGSAIVFASNRSAGASSDLWVRDLRNNQDRRVTSGQSRAVVIVGFERESCRLSRSVQGSSCAARSHPCNQPE